uniref:Reverse transcriptase Ty1/copia-type domain-containing protein n=1 Tax=Phytophthora ramorum TaxID=164328 RepID=H3H3Z1_PHYRM
MAVPIASGDPQIPMSGVAHALGDSGSDEDEEEERDTAESFRRSTRVRHPNPKYRDFEVDLPASLVIEAVNSLMEPQTVQEALIAPDAGKWIEALEKEYIDLMRNNMWELVERPKGKKVLSMKFILLLALHLGLSARHVDFVTAFLNGPINDDVEIYMEIPEYFDDGSGHKYLRQCGFRRTKMDGGVYTRSVEGSPIFVAVYVDDLVIVGIDENIELVLSELRAKFQIKDLGPVTDLVHMQISYVPGEALWISQRGYIDKVLRRFGMEGSYADADLGSEKDDRRSITGFVLQMNGCTYAYKSHKHDDTCSTEFIAAAECSVMIVWAHNLCKELNLRRDRQNVLFQDNQSTIKVIMATKGNYKIKGVDLKYHKVRDLYERGDFAVRYCPTTDMLGDIFTKPLGSTQFCKLRERLNVVPLPLTDSSTK